LQNRYVGDIGDFVKYGLIRAVSKSHKIGIAWYLYPDENHNKDGRHIDYLDDPEKWRHLDPDLFDGIRQIVCSGLRDVRAIENSGLLNNAVFSSTLLSFEGVTESRALQRTDWYQDVSSDLKDASLIFADPDNGLCEDRDYLMGTKSHWKRIPISEVRSLTLGRTGIFYHHNSRRAGGHIKEIQHWIQHLGKDTIAIYWRRISNRTFFIVNPNKDLKYHVHEFAQRWAPHCEIVSLNSDSSVVRKPTRAKVLRKNKLDTETKYCPECGHTFQGVGWGGMDAHWKSKHEHIMPYNNAWPLIKAGKKPSSAEG